MPDKKTEDMRDQPWLISYEQYDPLDEGRREAIFALGNGVYVTRAATVDARQGKKHYPGTYQAGCYDRVPDSIAGEQDVTESLVNLPNWIALCFRIDKGAWFQLDEVEILHYFHGLDIAAGTTRRELVIKEENGRITHIRESRLVSMAEPHLCALRFELTPQNWSGEVEFSSALDGHIINNNVARYADYVHHHLDPVGCHAIADNQAVLKTCIRHSRKEVALALRTTTGARHYRIHTLAPDPAWIAHILHVPCAIGKTVTIEKVVAIFTSQDAGVANSAQAAHSALLKAGNYASLNQAHQAAWQAIWSRLAITADDEDLNRSLHFHAFHILQTFSPHTATLDAGIPARGWHGEAYRGHIFWDELFVLPFLTFSFPALAKEALLYRYRRLGAAREAAQKAGYRGAMYPWRSASNGHEVTPKHQKNLLSGQWMRDHTYLQRHVGSAIAFNIWQYYLATDDHAFLADYGAEMILEIARFWASIAQTSADRDRFEIKGIMGPDEYHDAYPGCAKPGLDNNAYTNIMAVWTLCRALEVLDHVPAQRRQALRIELDLHDHELAYWDCISRKMHVPFHGNGIISQFEGFDRLQEFNPAILPPALAGKRADWALGAIGKNINDYQVTKQADVLTLFYLFPADEVISILDRLGYVFSCQHILMTARYYLPRTTHRSSLSRVVYAGALAQADPELSWNLYQHALRTDLDNLKGESIAEGIHLGAMGASLDILQRRYLGISAMVDGLHVQPALPPDLGKVCLRFLYRGNTMEAETSGKAVLIRSKASNRTEIRILYQESHGKTVQGKLRPGEEIRIPGPD